MLARNSIIVLPVCRKKASDCTHNFGNNQTNSEQVSSNVYVRRFERSFSQTSASLFPFRGYRTRNHPHLSKSELKRKCLWTTGDFRSKDSWLAQFDPLVVAQYQERQRVEKAHMEKVAMERKMRKQNLMEGQDLFIINKPKVKSNDSQEKAEIKQFLESDARRMRASMIEMVKKKDKKKEKDKERDTADIDRYKIKTVDEKLGIKKKTDSVSTSSNNQVEKS